MKQNKHLKGLFNVKNKVIIALAALLAASCVMTACSDKDTRVPEREGVAPSTIEAEPEKEHFLISDLAAKKPARTTKGQDGTVFKSLEVEDLTIVQLAQADKQAAKNMRKVMDMAYDRHISAYDASLEVLYAELSAENVDFSVFPHETKVDYTCTRNDGRAISIIEEITSYSAGNPGATTLFAYNFDPITGNQVTQVLYENGNKQSFDDADNKLYEKLVNTYGTDVINYSNIASSFVDAAVDCWYFTENGIKINFNPGDAAKPEAGVIEVEYTKEELPEFAQKYFN